MEWYKTPTSESYLSFHTPRVDWESDKTWKWPWWKFGFKSPDVLFNQLHAEFNSMRVAIQDPYGWHLDVCDIAGVAANREEFLTLLRKRQVERFAELEEAWTTSATLLVAQPSRWETPNIKNEMWLNFIRISRNFSYDAFVGYFGPYVKDKSESTATPSSDTRLVSKSQQQQPPNETDINGEDQSGPPETEAESSRNNIEVNEGDEASSHETEVESSRNNIEVNEGDEASSHETEAESSRDDVGVNEGDQFGPPETEAESSRNDVGANEGDEASSHETEAESSRDDVGVNEGDQFGPPETEAESSRNNIEVNEGDQASSHETEPAQSPRNIGTEGTRARKRAASESPSRANANPNRAVKRQKCSSRASAPIQDSPRRSVRLQQARRKSL